MSDQDTGLPIRTEADGTDERVHVKIVDGTNPSVNQTTVDSDKNLHVELHGDDELGTDRVVALSESGNVALDGDYDGSTNTNPSSTSLIAHDRDAIHDRTKQNQRVTATPGEDNTVNLDISLHDENGQNYDSDNPLPVTLEESEGDEIADFQTSAAVIKNATTDHDYTITAGKTFIADGIFISGSGKLKVEVQVETAVASGIFDTLFVAFNSTANPNIKIDLMKRSKILAGIIIRIILTNRDNQPQDLYSTLLGVEK